MRHLGLLAWPLPPKLTTSQSVAVGAGILLIAVLLRFGLDYVIPGRLAFTTYFPAAMLAAYVTGAPGGLVVLAGGLVGSWFTWMGTLTASNIAIGIVGDGVFGISGGILVLAVTALREAIFELAEHDERARTINQELVHRNRNLFAIVTTLATQTMERAGINSSVALALRERITALARAQDLISLDPGQEICLSRLLEQILAPMAPDPSRLVTGGSRIGISARRVSGFALVFHELATNALKYGAWSGSSGRVIVRWRSTPAAAVITWQEEADIAIASPQRHGLGSVLIEQAIPGASVERTFGPPGLRIVLRVPLE